MAKKNKNVALVATQQPLSKEILVQFILDETGSMSSVAESTIGGFNEYVNTLKNDKENSYKMTLIKFDSTGIKTVYQGLNIKDVPELNSDTYKPNAMTNLNDAIGHGILSVDEVLKNNPNLQPLLVIMTDGYENASVEFNQQQIRQMIKDREAKGWTVTFLGANIDTQQVSNSYAIRTSNAKSYSTGNMKGMMRGLAAATTSYASNMAIGGVAADSASTDFFAGTGDWTKVESAKPQSVQQFSFNNVNLGNIINEVKDDE